MRYVSAWNVLILKFSWKEIFGSICAVSALIVYGNKGGKVRHVKNLFWRIFCTTAQGYTST